MYQLVIANRNYSSWSLRAWLFLTESGVAFEEIRVPMFTETWRADIARYSPAGRVPVLLDGDVTVWDSTAIFEYVREAHPDAVGWPEHAGSRAHARSVSAEMHAGFLAIRDELPQNIRAKHEYDPARLSESCQRQIGRVDEIWANCRERQAGDSEWLFGGFSLADIMFAPVALRFVTYSVPVSARASEFVAAVCRLETVQTWIAASRAEVETIPFIDELVPAASSPLTLG